MATKLPQSYTVFSGGIADFVRSGIAGSFAFGRSIDIRTDPNNIGVLPRTIKESGNVVTGLPKWSETYNATLLSFIYDANGTLYSRTSEGSYTNLRSVANSHGNGLVYSAEDNYLYYSLDKVIGRYGPLSSATPAFTDDFLGSFGGIPLNTSSLDLEATSSQYASRADTASLSITGDIAMDIQIKPESLPAAGSQMTLLSKWDESGALRSYKFDINTASGYFGDGSDGSLAILSDTTEAPIDSTCTGTAGSVSLSATNTSFAASQIVMIHQSQGINAGQWERGVIQSYTAGTITLVEPLIGTYTSGAQVRVLKQYTTVTVDAGVTYSAKAWSNATGVGGILAFIASGTVTIAGNISASEKGYRGGQVAATNPSEAGEGTAGNIVQQSAANGNGGGGAVDTNGGGAGGGNGIIGNAGGGNGGTAGAASSTADLTTMTFGGGGGGGGSQGSSPAIGGWGGGIVFISGATLTVTGGLTANGQLGGNANNNSGGGGGGAGGSILLKCQTATLGSSLITASGGSGGSGNGSGNSGGAGGDGAIHIDYYNSYTGSTTPTINATQDNSLVTNTSYQLRLSVSSTGSNSEVLAQEANIQIGSWQQVGVSWDASTSTAKFYLNAGLIGTRVGTLTAIHNNASTFQIGMSEDSGSTPTNFYDGLIDEVRLFNTERTADDMIYGLTMQIPVNTAGLVAYYKLNGDYTDATANANDLTSSGAPVFSSDVPYPSPTTRLDIDQEAVETGDTYTLLTAISEAAANKLTFTPAKDPQKSIQFNIDTVGTGNWTVTIHDSNNNVMATSTVSNANLHTGDYEFIYSNVWRPLTNFTNEYHAHITSTVADGEVVTDVNNDLETADFVTYYQFLVEDDEWHPMQRFLNFWVVGNERYLAKYEAPLYEPNEIIMQAGYRVRCLSDWREYKAIGVQKGNNIYDFDYGRIYFWDGIAPTFNFFIDVPEGGINAMWGSKGKLYIWAGYKNQLLVYEGGDTAQKLKDMPKMEVDKFSEIYPGAVTMWQSLLRYGVAGNGDSTAIQKGVYTYGSTNFRYPDILTYDYPISTLNYSGTGVRIGMVSVVNKKLLIGWQDGINYGVDYVDPANPPFISSSVDFLINDEEAVWKEKEGIEIDANFTELQTGQAVSLRYALEGSNSFTQNPDPTTSGDTISRLLIPNGRYHEIQVGVDITSTTIAPTIKGLVLISNALDTEGRTG